MPKMSELWEKMKEGDKVVAKRNKNYIAVRENGYHLVWDKDEREAVNANWLLSYDKWELVEDAVVGETKTEKWMPVKTGNERIFYVPPNDDIGCTPSLIMDRTNFLRWGGTVPVAGRRWPGDRWCIWVSEDGYRNMYDPDNAYIKQVFAEYAEMRVEK